MTVRFCTSTDGTRIAWSRLGAGVPIVRAAHYLTNIETDLDSPIYKPWLASFARIGTLVRYDQRGCGLSDRDVADCSLDAMVADLEAVVDASGVDRFVLLGISQGGATALRYAARHPERVERLVLLGAFARGAYRRGDAAQAERARLMVDMIELGWGQANPAFHHAFSTMLLPDAPPELAAELVELQRVSSTPRQAARIFDAVNGWDALADAADVRAPALVMHARDDARVPMSEGLAIAAALPDARFVPLDGRNHLVVHGEPAFAKFFEALRSFVGNGESRSGFADLNARERELLQFVAMGLDNAQIAARLGRSEKTVRNNVSALFARIGAENRAQAIVQAREAGFGREGA